VRDPTGQLRSATRRAKSDVANKLVSMFLHELSRRVSRNWPMKVGGSEYEALVRQWFNNRCPYCLCDLAKNQAVIEHLDGMNRIRAGLHVPGNVLVACKRCNSEKRRDDVGLSHLLAASGWESFLCHDGSRCSPTCQTCQYWKRVWVDDAEREARLAANLERIRSFRRNFPEFERILPVLTDALPALLTDLYSECQSFAESQIQSGLGKLEKALGTGVPRD